MGKLSKANQAINNRASDLFYATLDNNGWLSIDGIFYTVEGATHARAAYMVLVKKFPKKDWTDKDVEQLLEKLGWLKLKDNKWYSLGRKELTQGQLDFLFDWCNLRRITFPPTVH